MSCSIGREILRSIFDTSTCLDVTKGASFADRFLHHTIEELIWTIVVFIWKIEIKLVNTLVDVSIGIHLRRIGTQAGQQPQNPPCFKKANSPRLSHSALVTMIHLTVSQIFGVQIMAIVADTHTNTLKVNKTNFILTI